MHIIASDNLRGGAGWVQTSTAYLWAAGDFSVTSSLTYVSMRRSINGSRALAYEEGIESLKLIEMVS